MSLVLEIKLSYLILSYLILLHGHYTDTDLIVTEFLSKIILFPEDCESLGLSQDPSDKQQIMKYGSILLGVHFNLCYSKLK